MTVDASPVRAPAREVTDDELAEAAARVRRHRWRDRGAMGGAMVIGFAGVAVWLWSGFVLAFIGSLFLGSVVYGALRPKGDPLDDDATARADDPEVQAMAADFRKNQRRRALGWLGAHLAFRACLGLGTFGGATLGVVSALGLGYPLEIALRQGLAIGVAAGTLTGWLLGRMLSRRIQG